MLLLEEELKLIQRKYQKFLGCPVVEASGAKGIGAKDNYEKYCEYFTKFKINMKSLK